MKNLSFIPIKRPAFFMSVLVTCGIITAGYFSWVPPLVWLLTAWLSAICMMASIAAGRKLATTLLAASGSFCLGAGTAQVMTQTVSYHHVALEPPTDEIALIGRIVRDPETTDRGIRLTLSVQGVESGEGLLIQKCGLIRLFISDDEIPSRLASRLQYGAVIRAEVCLNPPGDYHNPGTFSQRRYLAIQDIHLTGTIRFTEFITVLSDPSPVRLDVMLHRLRSFFAEDASGKNGNLGK